MNNELPIDDPRNYLHPLPIKTDESPVFYRDQVVDKMVRVFLMDGRKELMRTFVYNALERIKRIQYKKWINAKTEEEKKLIILDPFVIANRAIHNCRPLMKLLPYTRGIKQVYFLPYIFIYSALLILFIIEEILVY